MPCISEDEASELLDWYEILPVVEKSMIEVKKGTAIIPQRLFMKMNRPATLLLMPCFSSEQNVISTKLVTIFPDNKEQFQLPSISAVICMFDGDNGRLLCTISATTITRWRTAAASIVATRFLHCKNLRKYKKKKLAVLGTGEQGYIHIVGFHQVYKFGTIRVWNRTTVKAEEAAQHLKVELNANIIAEDTPQKCVKGADVILVTFSASQDTLLEFAHVKPGAFICVIGTSEFYPSGIATEIYNKAELYTSSVPDTVNEMQTFVDTGHLVFNEIADVMVGEKVPNSKKIILYQSLGLGIMDNAVGKHVYEKFIKRRSKSCRC